METSELINHLENASYFNEDLIFDSEICVEEVDSALKAQIWKECRP